jgi:dTDP-4-dehydrorhamnose 3,5-epimerase
MGKVKLEDISITKLLELETSGGNVLHAMKANEAGYVSFGEAYFSFIESGSIKAWKRHTKMIMNLVVPVGMVRFVFYLEHNESVQDFRVLEIGRDNYARITVPPGIWFGFQGLGKSENLVLNISNILHDTNEVDKKSLKEIKYDWDLSK